MVTKDAWKGKGDLGNVIGNPLETTVFLTRMIVNGTPRPLSRFENLRGALGRIPAVLSWADGNLLRKVRPNADCANMKHPSEYLKSQVLIDTIILSEEGLRHLVAEVGPGQVVFGTDMPFNWHSNVDLVLNAPTLNDAEKEAILGGTLVKLLRI